MKQVILLLYIAITLAIGIKAKATTLEKFILGDTLGTRAMVATIVSTFYGGILSINWGRSHSSAG